jgi:MFS family permease
MAMTGCGLSHSMGQFVLSAGLLGIGMGLAFTSVGALIVEVVPPASRGSAMGGYNTCIYLGMMLSSMIMGAVNVTFGFAMGFFLTAGVNLVFLGLFSHFFKGFVPSQDTSVV